MYWKCSRCGLSFERPQGLKEEDGLDSPPYRYTYVCPYCHSDDYDEYRADEDEADADEIYDAE